MPAKIKPYILLIEDNADDELLTLRAIKKYLGNTYQMKVIRDSVQVIDEIKQHHQETNTLPALVLLDLKLPKISGLELITLIRNFNSLFVFPIVILTTSTQEEDIAESYRRGANAYVQKQVAFEAFEKTIKATLHFWLNINQPPIPLSPNIYLGNAI